MSFKEIFTLFITGSPIKRKEWKGFWRSTEDGVYIFKKDGDYFQIGSSSNMATTLAHTTILMIGRLQQKRIVVLKLVNIFENRCSESVLER